jgi:hypothetical protein
MRMEEQEDEEEDEEEEEMEAGEGEEETWIPVPSEELLIYRMAGEEIMALKRRKMGNKWVELWEKDEKDVTKRQQK